MIDFGNVYCVCDECPLCSAQIQRKIDFLGDDWYSTPEHYCEKVEKYDFCSDALIEKKPVQKRGKRQGGRAYRRAMKQKKLERRKRIVSDSCISLAGNIAYKYVDGRWQRIGDYVQYPNDSSKQRDSKRWTSKAARKTDLPKKGNAYRKCFDMWWYIF